MEIKSKINSSEVNKLTELLAKIHMNGQYDGGCKHPSWSNALSAVIAVEEREVREAIIEYLDVTE